MSSTVANSFFTEYQHKMLSDPVFLASELKKFEKTDAHYLEWDMATMARHADYVTTSMMDLGPQYHEYKADFANGMFMLSFDQITKGNSSSFCNIALACEKYPDSGLDFWKNSVEPALNQRRKSKQRTLQ
jgi:hypothetical protein